MKILKRNQLVILVISLMLVTAGYLNFTSTNNNEANKDIVAELGDATLVSSNNIEKEEENIVENKEEDYEKEEEKEEEDIATQETDNINEQEEGEKIVETVQEDTYFTTSKLERENIYPQMLETYQETYNNTNSISEQKEAAIQEIAKINKTRSKLICAAYN